MGISGNALAFIGGAAEQFAENKQGFKKELRENKRKQKEWLNTYGNKALEETKQQQESVELALDELEARGLKTPDALQLLQRHGVNAVLELNKTVKDYESANSTTVDADLMNKIWKAAEDFTPTSQSFEEAVSKVFGTNKAGSTAPVIQESEERGFFDKIKANLSGAYEDEEYDDFLNDASEGMGGYTINELRAMSASSLSMVGSDGAAVFDRSVLRGSESTTSERASWNELKGTILSNALNSLDPTVANQIRIMQGDITDISRNDDEQWNILTATNAPEEYKEAIAEATRNAAQGIDLGSNRAAWNSYGGQDALNAILNPPEPPTPEEKAEQLEQDLIDNNLTEARPEDLGESTDVQVGEYFRDNNKDFVISNGELVGRPEDAPFDESKVVELPPTELPVEEGTYNTDDLTLKVQPTVAPEGIPERPEPRYAGGEKTRPLQKPLNKRAIDDWDDQYEDKYNPDATYKIVRPQGPRPEDTNSREYYEYELWDATYGDTHDPLTGYPLIEGLDKTLIPNSEVAD
tara:strand:- start:57 stop:1625 length:1569 start_codon:yes stop_codon:yes gene_type:complete